MKDSITRIKRKTELIGRSAHRLEVSVYLPRDIYRSCFMKRECRLQLRRCIELTLLLILLSLKINLHNFNEC